MRDSPEKNGLFHPSVVYAVERLKELNTPVLTFAQTVFWDDPMKAVLLRALRALDAPNRFVAGIHDTDYFSKLLKAPLADTPYLLVSRNDTTTKELWAATAETAALFGSETPVPISQLLEHGVALSRLCDERRRQQSAGAAHDDPRSLDHITEAWGWKAVAFRGDHAPVASDVRVADVIEQLQSLLDWAIHETLSIVHPARDEFATDAEKAAQELRSILSSEAENHSMDSLTELYRSVNARLYRWLLDRAPSGECSDPRFETAACSYFFRFRPATCDLPRFRVLELFLRPETRATVSEAYDHVLSGSGIYELDRFGTGALPFDLFVPKRGRGTLRVEERQCVVHFRDEDVTVSQGEVVEDNQKLAEVIESRFGDNCALLGKALVLPTMFAMEGVMLLNEGASVYIPRTKAWVHALHERGIQLPLKPLLRLRYRTLDTLASLNLEFHLPLHLQETFCFRNNPYPAEQLAGRWREVLQEQRKQLELLTQIRSSRDLIPFLSINSSCGPSEKWYALQDEYHALLKSVHRVGAQLTELTSQIALINDRKRGAKRVIETLERQSGKLRRAIRENLDLTGEQREKCVACRAEILGKVVDGRAAIRELDVQRRVWSDQAEGLRLAPAFLGDKERLLEIELEAEEQRLHLARNALLATGLDSVNRRPCAWWFPIVDPTMGWWEEVTRTTEAYFEEW
ncbi:MAG: hypothetical protein AUJ92_12055 [Armatimonadetes bacterium CG2_30_59_28]|nr:hypothetical protein [Armatimonadota bacterium]OIO93628.1 MAG: hypothetical protein AUJ92_12055 [Armatimonadetes bacterium CG2_30_59_28]PIU66281.1 MAG: hypothetical protein COS85_05380 [Armatimonadetes bacterium CG07_land_8_20_14_0_80_59_28]PIY41045.1 MAG: hypothetical protein COZ05_16355 [Armatimonadetes bacterium CG_4_10_14_3_um_filter_59_10]PJB71227.1 MAG: hypothetical protein CO095_08350 [Armatimonadetes bacterium CG_4_9_14_3_um_filter_58_7]